jgi:hypothetical protein
MIARIRVPAYWQMRSFQAFALIFREGKNISSIIKSHDGFLSTDSGLDVRDCAGPTSRSFG